MFLGPSYSTRSSDSTRDVPVGVPFTIWGKVVTDEEGRTTYRFKMWAQGDPEPSGGLTFVTDPDEPQPPAGSIVLLAHNSSVLWERVEVTTTGR